MSSETFQDVFYSFRNYLQLLSVKQQVSSFEFCFIPLFSQLEYASFCKVISCFTRHSCFIANTHKFLFHPKKMEKKYFVKPQLPGDLKFRIAFSDCRIFLFVVLLLGYFLKRKIYECVLRLALQNEKVSLQKKTFF